VDVPLGVVHIIYKRFFENFDHPPFLFAIKDPTNPCIYFKYGTIGNALLLRKAFLTLPLKVTQNPTNAFSNVRFCHKVQTPLPLKRYVIKERSHRQTYKIVFQLKIFMPLSIF
jgi:hypothetical protein